MSDTLGYPQISGMLNAAVAQIRANHERLSQLDSAVGDGDHGTTILRAMEAVSRAIPPQPASDLKGLFSAIGWAVMGCDGGSTGPLLGSFFLGMGEAGAGRTELDHDALVKAFEAGVAKLQKQSRAQIGDKTMMDAFLPALAALKAAPPAEGIRAALQSAAQAAAEGAEATKTMRARFGRARNLGDRVLGHMDPGAVSISLILKGFSEGA
jgi:dihydroxyacetone kinase-like protein